ncbi:helix-turn-helix domain-containing protein [Streptomyces sp. PmtG]
MTYQQLIAPERSASGPPGPGLHHVTEPHTERFTVVGNDLAQHRELSLTAIGLALHIQSLPAGARVGIKALAQRFPEGEIRIAAALRELVDHGYLAREKTRLPSGRIVTRVVSYNKPRHAAAAAAAAEPRPARVRASTELLIGLRAVEPRLLLSERDVRRLEPGVEAWLARGVPPDLVREALARELPEGVIRHPGAFLAHRLSDLLPPALPDRAKAPPPNPLQNCEGCDRAFRAARPGRCRLTAARTAPSPRGVPAARGTCGGTLVRHRRGAGEADDRAVDAGADPEPQARRVRGAAGRTRRVPRELRDPGGRRTPSLSVSRARERGCGQDLAGA